MAIVILLLCLAFIPALIAKNKGRTGTRRGETSFGIWWLYGVILLPVAIIHALMMKSDQGAIERRAIIEEGRKKCPFCAELVKSEANVCRFCGRNLPVASAPPVAAPQSPSEDRWVKGARRNAQRE